MVKFIFEALIVSLMIIVIQAETNYVDQCEIGTLYKNCPFNAEGEIGICSCDSATCATLVECREISEVCNLPLMDPPWAGTLMLGDNGEPIRCNTECQPIGGNTPICRNPYDTPDEGYCCMPLDS